ncbi:tripartite tricarboxylate transporter substrate-binding protein [Nonomuraea sp. NPDC050404]|uniref:Bug family tripartite tricarboxylate transporter substrate binding protein n=1 Tax=Nonomuraea sp. NPDC050404 TaxID=3155783 RepID=UPI0034013ED2
MRGYGERGPSRRRFLVWGLGLAAGAAACAAGCGTEHAGGGGVDALRTRFSINPGGPRWARAGRAFAGVARAAGFMAGGGPEAGRAAGFGSAITLTGLPALAAAELNNAQSLLDDATPLARLSGEVEVVVVPDGSPLRDFDDFGAQLLARPGQTPLAGGPQGEPDHLLFGLIARALGADGRQVDYSGYPSSGEAVTALLAGKAAAAAGPLRDWRAGIGRGRVRALAVSSALRVPDLDVPTLLECGARVDFADWVGAFGPAGMSDESRDSAVRMCAEVIGSSAWEAACQAAGWLPIPLSGDDFANWLDTEIARTRAVLRDLGLLPTAKEDTTCWVSCGNGH